MVYWAHKLGFEEMLLMIQEIRSFEKYEDFIGKLARPPVYSDPHFTYDK